MLSRMIIKSLMIIWRSNDRCETLNMILASLLKHCFSGHAHFCTVSYYMNKFDGLNFCWPKEHSTNNSTHFQRTISADSYYSSHFHSTYFKLEKTDQMYFFHCSTSFISDYIDAILM